MKAFVITLTGNAYSERKAARCIETAGDYGLEAKRFPAVGPERAESVMKAHGLKWTWAKGNTAPDVCPITGLHQKPYGKLLNKIGCSMSHYLLWLYCAERGPVLILEHDAVFVRELPEVEHRGICMINDPRGATPKGAWWSDHMNSRGPGVWPKTVVFNDGRPDGLAGNSAYLMEPEAAAKAVNAFREYGVWPNDATLCRQLFELDELYPFVTRTEQEQSTTT